MSLRRLTHLIPRHSSPSIPNVLLQSISKPHLTTTATATTAITNRPFSTEAPKKTKKEKSKKTETTTRPTTLAELQDLKRSAKQHRTKLYATKISNRGRHQRNRNLTKKKYFKTQFRSWFDPYKLHQEYLERESRRKGLPWRHRVAVLIERLPVVTGDTEGWDEDYGMLRAEMDRWGKVYPKELGFGDPMDSVVMTKEELYELLPEGFTPMPRETPADASGFLQTLDRKLKTRVYLTIRHNDTDGWIVPTLDLNEVDSGNAKKDETIVECAKRAVKLYCGGDFNVKYIGNAPMGVTMATNEELGVEDSAAFGVKTFYLRIQYDEGKIDEERLGKNVEDWGWLDRDEMTERVKEEKGEKIGNFFHYLL